MTYLAYLFLSHLPCVESETRFIDGREQVCLILPTESNQIKKGKQGNWMMILRLAERFPNAKQITHDVQLQYLLQSEVDKSYRLGYHDRTAHMGRVYVHDRTPERKIDRTNRSSDVCCDGIIILSDIPKDIIFRNAENDKRYLGKLTFKSTSDDSLIYTGSICVDDIPSQHIKTGPNTGKKYVNTRFKKLEKLDTYMNTHKLVIITDEGSEIEIGRFKEWQRTEGRTMAPPPVQPEDIHNTGVNQRQTPESIDGLKF